MADLKKSIEIIFEGTDNASRKAADVLAEVRKLDQSQKDAAAGSAALAKGLDDVGSKAPGLNLLNGALAGLSVKLVFDRFVEANVAVADFDKGIRAVKGSTADTSKELEYIRGVAEKFGVEVGTLTKGYTSLTAATIGSGLEGKATKEVFEAVTRAMGAMGKSGAETEGALKAIEQIAGKGRVQMEELRGQLGDRLPGALNIAARALGVTVPELENLVKQGLSATEFLPKFAAELEKTFAGARFEGYTANAARLSNAVDAFLVSLGKATGFNEGGGLKSFLTDVVKAGTVSVDQLSGSWDAFIHLARTGDFERLAKELARLSLKTDEFGKTLKKETNESLAETNRLLEKAKQLAQDLAWQDVSDAFRKGGDQFDAETKRLQRYENAIHASAEAFKILGIEGANNAEKLRDKVLSAFEELARASQTTSKELMTGLPAALKNATNLDDLNRVGGALGEAFAAGKISARELELAVNDLAQAQKRIVDPTDKAGKAIKDAAKEARDAEDRVQKFRLEMEKLASNERIKAIEAKVTLDIANVQANTERVKALLASIDNTVNSTGQLLGKLFEGLGNSNLDWGARRLIEEQVKVENQRRQEALDIQKKISEAQIEHLRAQTRAIERGDTMIKVDGAGLQPHLEAFMWEILRTIQVRVNQDGLNLLLGVA